MKTTTTAIILTAVLLLAASVMWAGGVTAQGTPTPWLPARSGDLAPLPTATKPSLDLGQIIQNQPTPPAIPPTSGPDGPEWQPISVTGRSTYSLLMPAGWQLWQRSEHPDAAAAEQALLDVLSGIDADAAAQAEADIRAGLGSWHAAAFYPEVVNGRFISVVVLLADRGAVAEQLGLAATALPAEIIQAFTLEPEEYNNMVAGFGLDAENAPPLVQNWGVYVPGNGDDVVVLLGEADAAAYDEHEAAITGAVRSLVEGDAQPQPTPLAQVAPTTPPASVPAGQSTATATFIPTATATLVPSPTATTPTVLDPSLEPRYSRVAQPLTPANAPASVPYTLVLPQVGGPVDASPIAPGCLGYTNVAPDLKFTAQNVVTVVTMLFWADVGDAVMIVYAPDGRWYCVDDIPGFAPYGHPGVDVPRANGEYAVWIATKSPGALSGTLFIVVG